MGRRRRRVRIHADGVRIARREARASPLLGQLPIRYPDISINEIAVVLARKHHLDAPSRFLIGCIKREFEKVMKVLFELDLIDVDALRRLRIRHRRRPRIKSPAFYRDEGNRYGHD
jgi:hypothetical protein